MSLTKSEDTGHLKWVEKMKKKVSSLLKALGQAESELVSPKVKTPDTPSG